MPSVPLTCTQEEQRELANTIRVSGSILLSTVSNFLDFFKMVRRPFQTHARVLGAVLGKQLLGGHLLASAAGCACRAAAVQPLLPEACLRHRRCLLLAAAAACRRPASGLTLCAARWCWATWCVTCTAS